MKELAGYLDRNEPANEIHISPAEAWVVCRLVEIGDAGKDPSTYAASPGGLLSSHV